MHQGHKRHALKQVGIPVRPFPRRPYSGEVEFHGIGKMVDVAKKESASFKQNREEEQSENKQKKTGRQ